MDPVSILHCSDYTYHSVRSALARSIEMLGGIDRYISKGDTVFLKLNLVMAKKPESAATTHPIFVQALGDLLKEFGATVILGDSPGGPYNEFLLKQVYKICGIQSIAEKSGFLLNFNTKSTEVSHPSGEILKKLTVTDSIRHVDKIISVGKLKTHGMMKMTGAVKNMFGIIPGTMKAEYHLNRPDLDLFAQGLIDICLYSNPCLSFLDGIIAMEGDGPTSGIPRHLGVICASANPFELDFAAASLICPHPETIPTIRHCIRRRLCSSSLSEIQFIGDTPKQFMVSDFKMPQVKNINPLKNKLPSFLEDYINHALQPRPVFCHTQCISCGDCLVACPPKAISFQKKKPVVNYAQCIRCFCCQELCPQKAVEIYRPFLFRLISK